MEVHVGCSGWFYWHWKGLFYPEDVPTHRWFKHYLKHFKTVELNAPFYGWPKPATVKGWKRNAPENFRYSVKVNRIITHEKRMVRTKKVGARVLPNRGRARAEDGMFPVSIPAQLSLHARAAEEHRDTNRRGPV